MSRLLSVALAIAGHILAYRSHRSVALLVLGAGGGLLFFFAMYALGSEPMVYVGLGAMLIASIVDLVRRLRIRRDLRLRASAE